jgi:hypothetical protein
MNFENINQSEEKKDVFSKGPVIVGESLSEINIDEWDRNFIRKNIDLIHRLDTARNQAEASMIYEESIQTEDRDLVKKVYDFVKRMKKER